MSSILKSVAGFLGKEKGYHMAQFDEIKRISKIADPTERNKQLDEKSKEIEAFVKDEVATNNDEKKDEKKKYALLTYIKFLKGEVMATKIIGGINTSTNLGRKIRSEVDKTVGGRRTRKNKRKNNLTRHKK